MKELLLCSDYICMWTAIAAVAQGFASILAIATLLYTITSFRKSLETSHYTELDRMYFDLLRVAWERPELTNPESLQTAEQKAKYDIYAFMVWNFLETIYDRCRRDCYLRRTWYPIVETENLLHRKWFDRPENRKKFKVAFHRFIEESEFTWV